MQKTCSKCNIPKDLSEFGARKGAPDGYQGRCRKCASAIGYAYWQRTKEADSKRRAKRYQASIEERRIYRKKYREANLEQQREYHRLYVKKRRAEDPSFNIATRLRVRVNNCLRNGAKSAKTEALLGMTFEEFKVYIESRFTEGMSWEAYFREEIHIDHEKPCCAFDLTDPAQQAICFHYSNMRPMWAKDNLAKMSDDKKQKLSRKASESGVSFPIEANSIAGLSTI